MPPKLLLEGLDNARTYWLVAPRYWLESCSSRLEVAESLGFTAVSYVGIQSLMDWAKDYAFSALGSVPSSWLQVLGLLQLDVCLSIYFSAYIARAVLTGMNSSGEKNTIRWGGK